MIYTCTIDTPLGPMTAAAEGESLVGLWFVGQLFSEVGSIMEPEAALGGVAYMAHIGGFIFGAIASKFFEVPDRLAARRSWAADALDR